MGTDSSGKFQTSTSGDVYNFISGFTLNIWTGIGALLTPTQIGEVKFQVGQLASALGTSSIAMGNNTTAN